MRQIRKEMTLKIDGQDLPFRLTKPMPILGKLCCGC